MADEVYAWSSAFRLPDADSLKAELQALFQEEI
jgi:hypothetical protein